MDIRDFSIGDIEKARERAFSSGKRHLYPGAGAAWTQGWWAGVRFAQRVASAYNMCEQCGKLITDYGDFRYDAGFTPFCAKCYDKVFNEEKTE